MPPARRVTSDNERGILANALPSGSQIRCCEASESGCGPCQTGRDGQFCFEPLVRAVFALEFSDVMEFTRPPRFVQRILFGLLAPIARMFGYQGSYPEYLTREPSSTISVAPLPLN